MWTRSESIALRLAAAPVLILSILWARTAVFPGHRPWMVSYVATAAGAALVLALGLFLRSRIAAALLLALSVGFLIAAIWIQITARAVNPSLLVGGAVAIAYVALLGRWAGRVLTVVGADREG
jgi:hypothetical protein